MHPSSRLGAATRGFPGWDIGQHTIRLFMQQGLSSSVASRRLGVILARPGRSDYTTRESGWLRGGSDSCGVTPWKVFVPTIRRLRDETCWPCPHAAPGPCSWRPCRRGPFAGRPYRGSALVDLAGFRSVLAGLGPPGDARVCGSEAGNPESSRALAWRRQELRPRRVAARPEGEAE